MRGKPARDSFGWGHRPARILVCGTCTSTSVNKKKSATLFEQEWRSSVPLGYTLGYT
jgi:hypothetical protein